MTAPSATPTRLRQVQVALAVRRRLAKRRALDAADAATRATWVRKQVDGVLMHATAHSPHYRRHAAASGTLEAWPTIDKHDLVDRFDEIVTDPSLRRNDLAAQVAGDPGTGRAGIGRSPLGRFRIAQSSGSSGTPGIVVFDPDEWIELIVNAARARAIAGRAPGFQGNGPVRSAKVGSPSPWHLSTQLPATLQDPRKPSLTLHADDPVDELVAALNDWQPTILSSYPSVLRRLAAEQSAGRLAIAPAQVFSSGEFLDPTTRASAEDVWDVQVFDQYVATEVGFIATQCPEHDGFHVLDDHVVLEVVDDHGAACAPGIEGNVVVTALHARTVPLIRYRIGDRATLAAGPCRCGFTGTRLAAVAGAERRALAFRAAARDGDANGCPEPLVEVHPVALTAHIDALSVGSWVVRHDPGLLRLEVTTPAATFDAAAVRAQLTEVVRAKGVHPDVQVCVEVVAEIETAPGGKAARFRPVGSDTP